MEEANSRKKTLAALQCLFSSSPASSPSFSAPKVSPKEPSSFNSSGRRMQFSAWNERYFGHEWDGARKEASLRLTSSPSSASICPVTQTGLLSLPLLPQDNIPDSRRGCTKAKRTWVRALEPNGPGWSPNSCLFQTIWHSFVSVHCPVHGMPLISPLYDAHSGIRGFSFPLLRKFLWSQTARVQILVPLKQPYLTSLGLAFPILKWEVQSTFLIGLFLGVSELTLTNHLYLVLNIIPITFGFVFVLLGHNSSSCLFQSLSSSFKLYKCLVIFSEDGPIFYYYRLGKYFKIIILYINTLNIFFSEHV